MSYACLNLNEIGTAVLTEIVSDEKWMAQWLFSSDTFARGGAIRLECSISKEISSSLDTRIGYIWELSSQDRVPC